MSLGIDALTTSTIFIWGLVLSNTVVFFSNTRTAFLIVNITKKFKVNVQWRRVYVKGISFCNLQNVHASSCFMSGFFISFGENGRKKLFYFQTNCKQTVHTFQKWHEYFMKSLVQRAFKEDFITPRDLRSHKRQRRHSVLLTSGMTFKISVRPFPMKQEFEELTQGRESISTGFISKHWHLKDYSFQSTW